jgi:hypothetical protein
VTGFLLSLIPLAKAQGTQRAASPSSPISMP